jgi:hypothetical protein
MPPIAVPPSIWESAGSIVLQQGIVGVILLAMGYAVYLLYKRQNQLNDATATATKAAADARIEDYKAVIKEYQAALADNTNSLVTLVQHLDNGRPVAVFKAREEKE